MSHVVRHQQKAISNKQKPLKVKELGLITLNASRLPLDPVFIGGEAS